MKKRKLKGFVLPTLYLFITISVFTGIILLGSNINLSNDDYNYGTSVLEDRVESVIVEDEITSGTISTPVDTDKTNIAIHFYNVNDEERRQQESLIYYENTYLPNTGVLYVGEEVFEVKSVFNGKVTEILEDEFFGECVVVEHSSNLRTYYYGLDEIEVEVGSEVVNGTVLGVSKINAIGNNKNSFLLEVYYNNELINPENFIGTKFADYE